jgi:hypothetical protein
VPTTSHLVTKIAEAKAKVFPRILRHGSSYSSVPKGGFDLPYDLVIPRKKRCEQKIALNEFEYRFIFYRESIYFLVYIEFVLGTRNEPD